MPKEKTKESVDGCRRYCLRIRDEYFERFQRLHRGTLSQFLLRCIVRACRSTEFFDDVYFGVRSDD